MFRGKFFSTYIHLCISYTYLSYVYICALYTVTFLSGQVGFEPQFTGGVSNL